MREEKLVAFAVVAFLWLSGLAVAASKYGSSYGETLLTENVLDVLQLPEEWISSLSNIITMIIAPFLAVTAIIYGLLTEMRIFRQGYGAWKINLIIAVCAVLTSMYLGWFRVMVTFLLAITGVWGTLVFFGLFFIGSIALVAIRVSGWRGEYGELEAKRTALSGLRDQRSNIDQQIVALQNKIASGNIKEIPQNRKKIAELQARREEINTKMLGLKEPE